MTLKVLVVDNNPVLLKAISTIVQQEGDCTVETASDGLQALEILKDFNPDLVFTDLVMPLVDGEMLCKILRHNGELKHTFIIVVSGVPFEQVQRIVDEIDCDLCIVKSGLPEMRLHIREALQMYQNRNLQHKKILATSESMQVNKHPELTLAEEVMLEKKHREEIVAYLSEGVIELNAQGKIVEINDAALNIFEVEKESVIGASLETLGWGQREAEIKGWIDEVLQKRQKKSLEFNEYKPVFVGSKVLTTSLLAIEGTSFFGTCIVKDITRLYRAEEYRQELDNSLRLVKRLEAMSGMAGGVAHDFNNLLTILCGNIEMVSGSLPPESDDKIVYLLDQAKLSAQGAIELARKISAFSPYGIINREVCETSDLLGDALNRYDNDKDIELVKTGGSDPIPISIDRDLMVKALHNVLDNSMEAGGCGNTSIGYQHIILSEPLVGSGHYVPAGSYAKIMIRDHGKGIAKGNLVAIFDPYFTTKTRGHEKGLGLGLAVVYSTLRNHGGYVSIDSVLEEGTEVSFFLPVASSDGIQSHDYQKTGALNRYVLVVEKDEQSRQVCTVLLEYLGFGVLATTDDAEIGGILDTQREAGHHVVAALVNVTGSNPENGIRSCEVINEAQPEIPVIGTCSTPMVPVMNNPRAYGFYNALHKPYTIDDLRNILTSVPAAA